MKRKSTDAVSPEKRYKNYRLYTEWVNDDGQFETGIDFKTLTFICLFLKIQKFS